MIPDNSMNNICANVRYLRKSRGISRTAMARKRHISLQTLDSLEAGLVPDRCSVNLLHNIRKVFGISLQQCVSTCLENER